MGWCYGRMFGDLSPQNGIDNVDGMLSQVPAEMILAFEGANEYNNDTTKGAYGVAGVAQKIQAHQNAMYTEVKSKSPGTTVIGPSFIQIHNNEADTINVGDLSHISDIATAHSYTHHSPPEENGPPHWNLLYKHNYPQGTPIYVTEFGFCNWLPEGRCTPENAAAKLAVRYYTKLFQHNTKNKGFIYEFKDKGGNDGEGTFGMVNRDANLTPKPIFYAVRNTIRILNETDGSYTPSSLDYTIQGKSETMHELLLQKKDGKFYLLLWNAPNIDYKSDPLPARANVTLTLTKAADLRVFEPTNSTNDIANRDQPLNTLSNVSLHSPQRSG